MNEFSCIGLTIEDSDQMYDFVASHEDLAVLLEKESRDYLKVRLGNLDELWFYQHDESGLLDTANPCIMHKSRWMVPIEFISDLSKKKNGPALINVNCVGGKINFPMNICVADGNLIEDMSEFTGAAVTMVSRELFLFKDEASYYNQIGTSGLGAECFVPTGMIPEDMKDMDTFVPSATALMCGTVMDARFETNPVSQERYMIIGVECLGYMFDVVACEGLFGNQEEFMKDYPDGLPKKGNILSGRYWLTGKVFK